MNNPTNVRKLHATQRLASVGRPLLIAAHDSLKAPKGFVNLIKEKLEKNSKGGRPHLLQVLATRHDDVESAVLNILELAWIKNKAFGSIARRYKTSYHTIYRLMRDLEPVKREVVEYLMREPRRKRFFNPELETSNYASVQWFIRRAKREGLVSWKGRMMQAEQAWKDMGYKDPSKWTADEVVPYLTTLTDGAASSRLDGIRAVAPQVADKHSKEYVGVGRYREKLRRRKKDIFSNEFAMILAALRAFDLTYEEIIFKLHVTLGAREGSRNPNSGMVGLRWENFHKKFTEVDLYESKVRGGIWCRDCPVDLFFKELPYELRHVWIDRGKPSTDKLILRGYKELNEIYRRIREACKRYWKGKTEPGIMREIGTLKPHDADKIHVNLLWEAEIPLEVVAGQDLGRGEALGLMGRVWLDINTIKRYYLSLTQRSDRFKRLEAQVKEYSRQFDIGELWYVS